MQCIFVVTIVVIMIKTIGIRELKANPSAAIEYVRTHCVSVDITNHGKVVARIVPVKSDAQDADWAEIDALAVEIGAMDVEDVDMRRDL